MTESNVLPFFRAPRERDTAVVYCEANFGRIDGKTANGLVRHSERYEIVAVLDSTRIAPDAGIVLGEEANGIPVLADLDAAGAHLPARPDAFIIGVAPTSGLLTEVDRSVVLDAMARGMHIVNGLHEFLEEDAEFAAAALFHGVSITDVRRPPAKKDLHMFTGEIHEVSCPRIAVLGTDGAIGKRTTATVLTKALKDRGLNAVMVTTGQTGLIQGAAYGVALDAIPAQFCAGELEAAVVAAFRNESPDVIIVEGQGALSHPTYMSSTFVLRGACPAGVVLQHAPARTVLSDFPSVPMPTPASEIHLIETFADTRVIGLTLNHENMTDAEVSAAIVMYERSLGLPTTDVLTRSPDRLVQMVMKAFPRLQETLPVFAR